MELRGHHLVCLHFYRGEGYSPAFVEHLAEIVRRAEEGEEIKVAPEADDVCRACPYLQGGCCEHKEGADEEIRKLDRAALAFLQVNPGDRVSWQDLREKVLAAPNRWFDSFCTGCNWLGLCSRVRSKGK